MTEVIESGSVVVTKGVGGPGRLELAVVMTEEMARRLLVVVGKLTANGKISLEGTLHPVLPGDKAIDVYELYKTLRSAVGREGEDV